MVGNGWRGVLNGKAQPARGGRRWRAGNRPRCLPRVEILEDRLAPAAHTWSGAGGNSLWDNAGNWSAGGAPQPGETDVMLTFPAVANTTGNNNVTDLTVSEVDFTGGGYTITGNAITLADSAAINVTAAGNNAFNLPIALTQNTISVTSASAILTLGGALSTGPSTGNLTKVGAGTLTLTGNNTFTQPILLQAGTLVASSDNALGSATGDTEISSGASLAVTGGINSAEPIQFSQGANLVSQGGSNNLTGAITLNGAANITSTLGSLTLSGPVQSNTFGLTVDVLGVSTTTIAGVITGAGGGNNNLTKTGPGTLILSAANTYADGTVVNGGTLSAFNTMGSATGPGSVTVNNGGTLAGIGTFGGAVTVNSGGTVSPGVSGPGTLAVGSIAFTSGSTLAVDLNGAAPQFDVLNVNGAANLGNATLTVVLGTGFIPSAGQMFDILTSTTRTGTFSAGSAITAGGRNFSINYAGGTGNDVVLTATQTADLAIAVGASPNPVLEGQALVYTLTITNSGPNPSSPGATVSDTLPAGLTFISAVASRPGDTVTFSAATNTISATLGSVPIGSGNGAVITITAMPNTGAPASLINMATVAVATGDTDPNLLNNTATSTTNVTPASATTSANLQVATVAAPDPVLPGEYLTYTITVSNLSTNAATGTMLFDQLPAGVTFVSATSTAGTPTQSAGLVTVNLGTVTTATPATVTISVLPTMTTAGTLTNTAIATTTAGDTATNNNVVLTPSARSAVPDMAANLAVTNTGAPATVLPGQLVTFTITVTNQNTATAAADGTTLTNVLPAGLAFVSATTTAGTFTQANGVVTANLGSLAVGASATVTVTALVTTTTAGMLSDTAIAGTITGDSNPANEMATGSITVGALSGSVADLSVTNVSSPTSVLPGQLVTYTVTVTNASFAGSAAANTTLIDVLPAGLTFVSAVASTGTVSQLGGVVTANLGTLATGVSATVTINVLVTTTTAGTLNATATASTSTGDSNPLNNQATATLTVGSLGTTVADLTVTKSGNPATALPGQLVTYTITVTNAAAATAAAANTTLTDVLPAGLTFVSATVSTGTFTQASGVVTANLGTLAVGASATISITVLVTTTTAGMLSDTATASTSTGESDLANTMATATTTVGPLPAMTADLSVGVTAAPNPVPVGRNLTYTVTVTNLSTATAAAADTTLTDVLPAGVTFVSGMSSTGAMVNQAGGIVTVNLGSLAIGASATITIVVTVPTAAGTLTDTAAVSTSTGDSNPANNTATVSSTVTTPADLPFTLAAVNVTTIEKSTFNGTLAVLSDTDSLTTTFTVNITWGDGNTSTGQAVARAAGTYNIQGSHVYQDEGTFTVTVSVTDNGSDHDGGGNTMTATDIVFVREETLPITGVVTADERFVAEVFRDLLRRPAGAADITSWAPFLHNHSRADLVTAIINDPQHEYRILQVRDLYVQYLNRPADPGGLNAAVAFLAGGGTVEQVAAALVGSAEFFQIEGHGTNAGFAQALYQAALMRPAETAAQDSIVQLLVNNTTQNQAALRSQIAAAIFSNPADEYRKQVVNGYYMTFLDRAADPGSSGWVGLLHTGTRDEVVLADLVSSVEYYNKTA
jgi:uncharacterized repeat protein (TIGR01451 family)